MADLESSPPKAAVRVAFNPVGFQPGEEAQMTKDLKAMRQVYQERVENIKTRYGNWPMLLLRPEYEVDWKITTVLQYLICLHQNTKPQSDGTPIEIMKHHMACKVELGKENVLRAWDIEPLAKEYKRRNSNGKPTAKRKRRKEPCMAVVGTEPELVTDDDRDPEDSSSEDEEVIISDTESNSTRRQTSEEACRRPRVGRKTPYNLREIDKPSYEMDPLPEPELKREWELIYTIKLQSKACREKYREIVARKKLAKVNTTTASTEQQSSRRLMMRRTGENKRRKVAHDASPNSDSLMREGSSQAEHGQNGPGEAYKSQHEATEKQRPHGHIVVDAPKEQEKGAAGRYDAAACGEEEAGYGQETAAEDDQEEAASSSDFTPTTKNSPKPGEDKSLSLPFRSLSSFELEEIPQDKAMRDTFKAQWNKILNTILEPLFQNYEVASHEASAKEKKLIERKKVFKDCRAVLIRAEEKLRTVCPELNLEDPEDRLQQEVDNLDKMIESFRGVVQTPLVQNHVKKVSSEVDALRDYLKALRDIHLVEESIPRLRQEAERARQVKKRMDLATRQDLDLVTEAFGAIQHLVDDRMRNGWGADSWRGVGVTG